MSINVNWDLDSIFEGGSQSSALADFLARLTADLDTLEATDKLQPLTDETPTTLNPIEPGTTDLQPGSITSAEPGNVGELPEVDGIPCNGNHGGGGSTGECIGLDASSPDVTVPHINTGVTG